MSERLLFFDTETVTGWLDGKSITEVVEIGWVLIEDGHVVSEGESFSKSIIPIDPYTEKLIEISNEMIADAPSIVAPVLDMISKSENAIVIGHNVRYDFRVVHESLERKNSTDTPWYREFQERDSLDTLTLFRRVMPNAPNHKLKTAVSYAGGDPNQKKHRALPDAQFTKDVFFWMLPQLKRMYKVTTVDDLHRKITGKKPRNGQMSLI